MKTLNIIGDYIDRHAWTHWALALAFLAVFFALEEFGYSAAHDGAHLADAFLDIERDERKD